MLARSDESGIAYVVSRRKRGVEIPASDCLSCG